MPTPMSPHECGFTLVELMVAVSIAGILSSVALPSFERQLQKARRADALIAAMAVQVAQERFRSNANAYGSLAEIGLPGQSPAKHYSVEVTANDADGFELLATATGTQARDAMCRYMKVTSTGMNLVHASGPTRALENDAAATRRCWSLG